MTKQECAIIEAHTGYPMLTGEDRKFFHQYVEKLLGHPIQLHEIRSHRDAIQELSEDDYLELGMSSFDIEGICHDMMQFLLGDEPECDVHTGKDKVVFRNGSTIKRVDEDDDDMVNHPPHYIGKNGIEVIDVIDAFTSDLVGVEAVCTSHVLEYMCRWKHKNGLQDLEKARWYLNKLIKHVEMESNK